MGQPMNGKFDEVRNVFLIYLLEESMGTNNGHANEQEIIELLSGKRISNLVPRLMSIRN